LGPVTSTIEDIYNGRSRAKSGRRRPSVRLKSLPQRYLQDAQKVVQCVLIGGAYDLRVAERSKSGAIARFAETQNQNALNPTDEGYHAARSPYSNISWSGRAFSTEISSFRPKGGSAELSPRELACHLEGGLQPRRFGSPGDSEEGSKRRFQDLRASARVENQRGSQEGEPSACSASARASSSPGFNLRLWNLPTRSISISPAVSSSLM
jgi:hypothetical protein